MGIRLNCTHMLCNFCVNLLEQEDEEEIVCPECNKQGVPMYTSKMLESKSVTLSQEITRVEKIVKVRTKRECKENLKRAREECAKWDARIGTRC